MPLAAHSLLQTPAAAASKAAAEPVKSGGEHFSKVYSQASEGKPAVADSGKPLPAGKGKDAEKTEHSAAKPVDESTGSEPAVLVPVTPATEWVDETPPEAVPLQPEVQTLPWVAAAQAQVVADDGFDPEADPLDNMPAVRLAMEQGGHVSASSQSPTKNTTLDTAAMAQGQASGIAQLSDSQTDASDSGEGGEKAFKGLLDDGLKDLKSASSDTRVDDFANRLAALTQASVPKTVNALPVNQPLAMHQSGWSEEVVNRVMYLSSANLKSADIQLEPAELGRLDIRVNIAADQSAQVNFVSGHAGVREALDSQMHRLREMLAQQGMGQVDVNVSDQSRGWQGQEQQNQSRANARFDGGNEDESSVAPAEAVAPSIVLGSSAVDYYA
ncbi:MAG: flagellar hook-length control protein FliK [Pseudomonadota bacterium]